ncbi:hypothetical protein AB9F38_35045, partial [Rhizobium leguminosarum]
MWNLSDSFSATLVYPSLCIFAFSVGGAAARELRPEEINTASIVSIGTEKPAPGDPEPAIVRLQVLLDRTGSSPG